MKKLVYLESVGCYLDVELNMTYPALVDGGFDKDCGSVLPTSLDDECPVFGDWFEQLSNEDYTVLVNHYSKKLN